MDENAQESSNGNAISIFKTYPIVNLKTSEKKGSILGKSLFFQGLYQFISIFFSIFLGFLNEVTSHTYMHILFYCTNLHNFKPLWKDGLKCNS